MYNFTENNRNQFMTEGASMLNHYGHETADKGMSTIWEVFTQNKGSAGNRPSVAEVLSRHPNWDPDILAVRLTEEYSTSVDKEKISEFGQFLRERLAHWCEVREVKFACMTQVEVQAAMERINRCINAINYIPQSYYPVIVNGMTLSELQREYDRLNAIDDRFYNTDSVNGHRLSIDDTHKGRAIRRIISYVESYFANTLDERLADTFNRMATEFFPVDAQGKKIVKARFSKGQKTSKAVSKFFTLVGDEFVKFKDVQEKTWHDQSGNFHSRETDMGWNGQFAAYADGINPIKVKRYTFISINPLDYLTMSFFKDTSSCHTIDHQNLRPNNDRDGHAYRGMYQSGTLSYMLDGSSIVMYTTRDDVDIKHPWNYDKLNRCMFHLGEEKFVQGRLYPDGRDKANDDETVTIASCFRNIFQRVISECLGVTNLWTIKRNNDDYTVSCGTHYRDYEEYSDTLTCFLKGSDNTSLVEIGHNPICPMCGEEHTNSGSLHCGNDHTCYNDGYHVRCARCGCYIDTRRENIIRDVDTGNYYDDSWCAHAQNVYYCENVSEWHSENVYTDDYTGNRFYDPDNSRVTISIWDFVNEENANAFGFFKDESGHWRRRAN